MYVPSIFSDNMVLQRGIRLPVWGWDDTGREITVRLGPQSEKTTVLQGGYWRLDLEPIEPGPPLRMAISNGEAEIEFANILAGDVWVCSGQSNMGRPLCTADGSEQEIPRADFPDIRLYDVPHASSKDRQVDIDQTWQVCRPDSAKFFSAVGYWFGQAIHKAVGVPIGLINSSVGGASIECWADRSILESDADFRPILDRYDFQRAHARSALAEYERALTEARLRNVVLKMERPSYPEQGKGIPGGLFNAMMAPYIPYGIRGAIWYQGESNVGRAYQYRKLLLAMINDWRERWGQGDFPFLFVQLPNYDPGEQARGFWAELRDSQQATLAVPNTAMAVSIDIGQSHDIHPTNKKDFADRLARVALREAYEQDIPAYGPRYLRHEISSPAFRVYFSDSQGGLSAKDGKPLREFALAGADHRFWPAQARIEDNSIIAQSEQVPEPVALRYAWADDPLCNLVNGAGLPAAPFRTDDRPGVTYSRR